MLIFQTKMKTDLTWCISAHPQRIHFIEPVIGIKKQKGIKTRNFQDLLRVFLFLFWADKFSKKIYIWFWKILKEKNNYYLFSKVENVRKSRTHEWIQQVIGKK